MAGRGAENRWSSEQICQLLDLIESMNVVEQLDSKRQKNSTIFTHISEQIPGRTATQCRDKWKALKKVYREELRIQNRSG